ncbi:MAG: PepSY domain-containing protein [Rhizobiales bacterium]|nr:PepSY domain-containing protein [Hyphomicrobiales bacterium]NRB13363.1 PepSY domain-containing protein [Hyphomicrobiales bacterium]
MIRQLHSLPGLFIAILVIVLAVSGAILSLEPVLDRFNAVSLKPTKLAAPLNVAEVSAKIVQNHANVSAISRSANGTISVQYMSDAGFENDIIDPQTGLSLKAKQQSALFTFMKSLHRSFFINKTGNALVGGTAVFLLLTCISGLFMLAKSLGGWRNLASKSRGKKSSRLHIDISRIIIIGLLITSLTGGYMALVRFDFIGNGGEEFLPFPADVAGSPAAPIGQLTALKNIPITDLRELRLPFADDPFDVFSITTQFGQGYIDQASGEMLIFANNGLGQNIYEFIYMLHTGQGLWWWGLLLGIASLGMVALAITGTYIWWRRKASAVSIRHNVTKAKAETIILVGSEGNATWGFGQHLQQKLTNLGVKTHISAMNGFAPHLYGQAKHLIILSSTYGDGNAPSNATQFMQKLENFTKCPSYDFTILGFGDKQFSHFCKFAHDVELALLRKSWQRLMPITSINQQSAQSFEQWGIELGQALRLNLGLSYSPPHPSTCQLRLEKRLEYQHDGQHNTCILTFAASKGLQTFAAGDLLAILPPTSQIARFYSLASCTNDGKVEICVTLQKGGLCSTFLHGLNLGDDIEAYIQTNKNFRPADGQKPLILIGAGTGIAPFMGFIQENNDNRDIQLYWGGRHPDSDFLYRDKLYNQLKNNKLTQLNTAFSRLGSGKYVQDQLVLNANNIRQTIRQGGQIMICGGRNMAQGVRQSLDEILAADGLNIAALKTQKRYNEDVY